MKRVKHGYGAGVTITKKGKKVYLTGLEFMYGVHRAQGALDELNLTSKQKKAACDGLKRKKGKKVYLTGLEFMYGVHRAQGALDELNLTSKQKKAACDGLKRKKITRQDLRRWI